MRERGEHLIRSRTSSARLGNKTSWEGSPTQDAFKCGLHDLSEAQLSDNLLLRFRQHVGEKRILEYTEGLARWAAKLLSRTWGRRQELGTMSVDLSLSRDACDCSSRLSGLHDQCPAANQREQTRLSVVDDRVSEHCGSGGAAGEAEDGL
eukprot:753263-Hanusia_phi.AAC.4